MKATPGRIIWLFVATLLYIQGCARKPADPTGSRAEQEDNIREAVLLHVIQSSSRNHSAVIFIGVNNTDPGSQFLQRLSSHQLNIKPKSQSSWANGRVIDPATGTDGVIYDVGEIKWLDAQSIEVYGGWVSANLSASTCEYLVTWDDHRWLVRKNGTCAIS